MTTERRWVIGSGWNDRHGEAIGGIVRGFFDLRGDIAGGDASGELVDRVRLDRCVVCYVTPVDPACDLGICPACVTRLRR